MSARMTSILNALIVIVPMHIVWSWWRAYRRGRRARRKALPSFTLEGQPLVSVLIPAWNERTTLPQTLNALRQSDYPNWEVLIIAGGADGTYEYARQQCANWPNATVIEQPPRGKNTALNLGWKQARGEILVLLDADTLVAPDWLRHLIAPLTHGYTATTANYFPLRRTWVSAVLEMEKIAAYWIAGNVILQGCGGIALSRQAVEQIGGFPEDVTVGVDWDLWQRLAKQGGRFFFASQACARTALPHTLPAYWRNQVRWRRAHLRAAFRHFGRKAATGLLYYGIAFVFLFVSPLFFLVPDLQAFAPLFWFWILLRRLGLALECAAFEGQFRWLRQGWGLPILLVVDFIAAFTALCTFRKNVIFFQGARPESSQQNPNDAKSSSVLSNS